MSEEQQPLIQQNGEEKLISNPTFFKNILTKTENISQTIYSKSPMKSDKLENNVKQIDEQLAKLVVLLDSNVNKTLTICNDKMTKFSTSSKQMINNSVVVKKSNLYQSYLINTLEEHLNNIGALILKKDLQKLSQEENVELTQEQIVQRYKQLIENASSIVLEIFKVYYSVFQKTETYTRYQEAQIIQEIVFDIFKKTVFQPVDSFVIDPTSVFAKDLLNRGKQYSQQATQLVKQYYGNPQLLVQESKNVVLTIKTEVTQQKLVEQLTKLKQVFPKLQQSVITLYKDYLTIEFNKEYFFNHYATIRALVIKIGEFVLQKKTQVVEVSKTTVKESKVIYTNALEEYKRRKEELLKSKQVVEEDKKEEQN